MCLRGPANEEAYESAIKLLGEAVAKELQFFDRHGFVINDLHEKYIEAEKEWRQILEKETEMSRAALHSPMSRKMFCLGYLKGKYGRIF